MKKNFLISFSLSITLFMMTQCSTLKVDITAEKYKYNVNANQGNKGFIFSNKLIADKFNKSNQKNIDWKSLHQYYKEVMMTQKDHQDLGFFKQQAMTMLFVETNPKFMFQYTNTDENKKILDYYANELMSLEYQDPLITKNIINQLQKFWKKEQIGNFLNEIAHHNKDAYQKEKNHFTNFDFEKNGMEKFPQSVKDKIIAVNNKEVEAINYIQQFEKNK